MKYFLAYLIRGAAEKYHREVIRRVADEFNENHMLENPLPPHITLKAPFKTTNIRGLEKLLDEFTKRHHQGRISIKEFGNFERTIIFLNAKFDKLSKKIQKDLIEELKSLTINPGEYDISHSPHATVAYCDENNFDSIWGYLQEQSEAPCGKTTGHLEII